MYNLIYVGGGRYCASGKCVHTKQPYNTSPFYLSDFCKWKAGDTLIQDTKLGELSADDREFLISCIHPDFFEVINETINPNDTDDERY